MSYKMTLHFQFVCVGVNVFVTEYSYIVSRIGNYQARVLVIGEADNYGLNIIALKVFVKMLKREFWLHWNF